MLLSFENGQKYLKRNLGTTLNVWFYIGILFFIIVLTLSILLATVEAWYDGDNKNFYWIVFGFTFLTMFTVLKDYQIDKPNSYTIATIFMGSSATLFSLGLWATDDSKIASTFLVLSQAFANAIQMAAIFNENRSSVNSNKSVTEPFLN